MKFNDFKVAEMGGGKVALVIDRAVQDAIDDVGNLAKPAEEVRKVQVTITIHPNEDRSRFAYKVSAKTALPACKTFTGDGYLSGPLGVTASEVDPEQMELGEAATTDGRPLRAVDAPKANGGEA